MKNGFNTASLQGLRTKAQKGVAIIGFALVAGLLFSTVFMILAVGRMFYIEGVVKASLNDTLRTSEGDIDLWVREPQGADAQAFEKALTKMSANYEASGPTSVGGASLKKVKMKLASGSELPMRFAFLPPGYCAVVEDEYEGSPVKETVCNSHICGDPAKAPGNCTATVCNTKTKKTEEVPCAVAKYSTHYTWGSCEKDPTTGAPIKSLCAKQDDGKSYHHQLRNYPVEIKARYDVPTPIGKMTREIVVAGYPRIMVKEEVAAVPPPPACPGTWIPRNSCVPPAGCGLQTGTGVLTYTCGTGNAADCWCVPRPADHGTTTTCSSNNPYTGSWVLESNWGTCVFPNAGNTPASCQGEQIRGYVCSVPNCCDPGVPQPTPLTRSCSQPGGNWVSNWSSCVVNSGICGAGTETEYYTCNNPPCCGTHNPEGTRGCNVPCCDPCTENPPTCGSAPSGTQCVNGKKTWTVTGSWTCPPTNPCPPGSNRTISCEEPCTNAECVYVLEFFGAVTTGIEAGHPTPQCLQNRLFPKCTYVTDKNQTLYRGNGQDETWNGHTGEDGLVLLDYCYNNNSCTYNFTASCADNMLDVGDLSTLLGITRPNLPAVCFNHKFDRNDEDNRGLPTTCESQWYLDANCREVPNSGRICGVVHLEMTPISLEWETGADVAATVAKFSLNPTVDADWTVWQGSAQTPLLVYDPAHSGKITSPIQLFGNFALGGKETPLLKAGSRIDQVKVGNPFDNGYEGLGLLDSNQDGVLSGAEIAPLGLWFDANQDAVSQPGEVVSADAAGLSKLFYRGAKKQGQDMRLELGFERVNKGAVVKGASVDWVAGVYRTKSDALMALMGGAKASKVATLSESVADPVNAYSDAHEVLAQSPHLRNHVNGFWQWTITEESGGSAPGLLLLNDNARGVFGWSVANAKVTTKTGTGETKEMITAIPVNGKWTKDAEGRPFISLVLTDKGRTTEARSALYLSEDGQTLSGRTNQKFAADGSRPTAVSYSWEGRRVEMRPAVVVAPDKKG